MCPLKAKKVSVKATRYCPVLLNGCMNLILCILSHMYVCIKTKIWLYRLIYHSYRISSVISIYTLSIIYLYSVALYSSGIYHGKVFWGFTEIFLWSLFWHRYRKQLSKMTLQGVHERALESSRVVCTERGTPPSCSWLPWDIPLTLTFMLNDFLLITLLQ